MGDFNTPIHKVNLSDALDKKKLLSIADNDLVLNALDSSFSAKFMAELADVMTALSTEAHSRVLVALPTQDSDLPEDWIVVPTVGEAEDLIEMERIERDLGF